MTKIEAYELMKMGRRLRHPSHGANAFWWDHENNNFRFNRSISPFPIEVLPNDGWVFFREIETDEMLEAWLAGKTIVRMDNMKVWRASCMETIPEYKAYIEGGKKALTKQKMYDALKDGKTITQYRYKYNLNDLRDADIKFYIVEEHGYFREI